MFHQGVRARWLVEFPNVLHGPSVCWNSVPGWMQLCHTGGCLLPTLSLVFVLTVVPRGSIDQNKTRDCPHPGFRFLKYGLDMELELKS